MILIVFKGQNSLLDCFDTVNKLTEKKMQESIRTKLLKNARKVIGRYRILVRRHVAAIRQGSTLVTWKVDISSSERWMTEEKVPILREPELFKAQGCHSQRLIRQAFVGCFCENSFIARS